MSPIARRRRIALILEMHWPYKRHAETFAGALRYGADGDRWDCVVDEFVGDQFCGKRPGKFPYDGVVGRIAAPLARQLTQRRIPVVNVWANSRATGIPRVGFDHVISGRLRAEHLLDRGLQQFATLGVAGNATYAIEARQFAAEVEAAGHECLPLVVTREDLGDTPARRRRSLQSIDDWMDRWRHPIGVFIGPESLGRRIAQMCRLRRWRVPDDVALVCGYNQEELCEQPAPSLTSLEIGFDRIGYAAAELLDRLIDGALPPEAPILLPPIGIVARASTDFTAIGDELVQSALRYISGHLNERLRVSDVAAAALTSRATLERRFREHLGRPVATEIRRLRIEKAKRALARSTTPIYRIAQECGFASAAELSRTFGQEVGQTPSAFRQSRQLP